VPTAAILGLSGGLCGTSENAQNAKFALHDFCELPLYRVLRSSSRKHPKTGDLAETLHLHEGCAAPVT